MAALYCSICGTGPFTTIIRRTTHELTHLTKKRGI